MSQTFELLNHLHIARDNWKAQHDSADARRVPTAVARATHEFILVLEPLEDALGDLLGVERRLEAAAAAMRTRKQH